MYIEQRRCIEKCRKSSYVILFCNISALQQEVDSIHLLGSGLKCLWKFAMLWRRWKEPCIYLKTEAGNCFLPLLSVGRAGFAVADLEGCILFWFGPDARDAGCPAPETALIRTVCITAGIVKVLAHGCAGRTDPFPGTAVPCPEIGKMLVCL